MTNCKTEPDTCTLPEGEEENDILNIIKEEGIINYTRTVKIATQRGDNFMGSIYGVDVIGYDREKPEIKKEIHLILKCSPRSSSFRQFIPVEAVFKREICIYTEYLPEIYKIQSANEIQNGLLPAAKLYKYSMRNCDEYLIMENKKVQGFTMCCRKSTLDLHHCKLVLEQLGYFHGLSYVLRHTKSKTYCKIVESVSKIAIVQEHAELWIKQFGDTVTRALNLIDPESEKDIYTKLEKLREDVPNVLMESFAFNLPAEDRYSIIIHGDCWTNNILFKYNENGKPMELCFLDFQNSRVASPVLDLAYFIYTCTGTELRNKHFDDMLTIYHNALSKIVTECGLKVERCLPFPQFQKQIKKHFKFGVIVACLTIPMFISESEEIPEFQNIENFDESTIKQWNFESKNNYLYEERIRGVIFHAVSRDFI